MNQLKLSQNTRVHSKEKVKHRYIEKYSPFLSSDFQTFFGLLLTHYGGKGVKITLTHCSHINLHSLSKKKMPTTSTAGRLLPKDCSSTPRAQDHPLREIQLYRKVSQYGRPHHHKRLCQVINQHTISFIKCLVTKKTQ